MKFAWGPVVFVSYPIFYFYSINVDFITLLDFGRAVAIFAVWGLVLWLLARLITRSGLRAAVIVVIAAVVLLPYSPLSTVPSEALLFFFKAGTLQRLLFLAATLSIAVVLRQCYRRKISPVAALNLCAVAVIVPPLFVISVFLAEAPPPPPALPEASVVGEQPHIFYLVLDGYGGRPLLEEILAPDHLRLAAELEELGFYVADRSSSNYAQTALSLSSALNFDYLQALLPAGTDESGSRKALQQLFAQNRATRFLAEQGYTLVSFPSGYGITELVPEQELLAPFRSSILLEGLLASVDWPFLVRPLNDWLLERHADRIEFVFDQLPKLAQRSEPLFVWAHVIAPHPPFVFNRDGSRRQPEIRFSLGDGNINKDPGEFKVTYRRSYGEQLHYISTLVLQVVQEILREPGRPAVIIIHSDHGPGSRLNWWRMEETHLPERFSILNAIYLPGRDYPQFYPELSPVNNLRLVFNQQFGTELELRPDINWFSGFNTPFAWEDVSSVVQSEW